MAVAGERAALLRMLRTLRTCTAQRLYLSSPLASAMRFSANAHLLRKGRSGLWQQVSGGSRREGRSRRRAAQRGAAGTSAVAARPAQRSAARHGAASSSCCEPTQAKCTGPSRHIMKILPVAIWVPLAVRLADPQPAAACSGSRWGHPC